MDLKQYLRTVVNDKIRPLFIKDECEVCGNIDDLHLHHVTLFSEILKECLRDLNLYDLDTNEYKEKELKLITDIVLGRHLQINYLTLCSECHKKAHDIDKKEICTGEGHKQYYDQKRAEKEIRAKVYLFQILTPYLDTLLNKKLFFDDQLMLSQIIKSEHMYYFNQIDYRTEKISIVKLKKLFKDLNIPYSVNHFIETKGTMRGKRYIVITTL